MIIRRTTGREKKNLTLINILKQAVRLWSVALCEAITTADCVGNFSSWFVIVSCLLLDWLMTIVHYIVHKSKTQWLSLTLKLTRINQQIIKKLKLVCAIATFYLPCIPCFSRDLYKDDINVKITNKHGCRVSKSNNLQN